MKLLSKARGDVLECGVGTGLNLPGYLSTNAVDQIHTLTGIDISDGMLRQARARANDIGLVARLSENTKVATATTSQQANDTDTDQRDLTGDSRNPQVGPLRLVQADVARLPFEKNTFDSVVDTFSVCVFPDPEAALQEMARVTKPGGRLLLLEHVRSSNRLFGWYQDTTNSAVSAMSKGCSWNQDVRAMVEALPGVKVLDSENAVGGLVQLLQAEKVNTE